MFKLLKRVTETAIKLPFSIAWDAISLGNMGDGSSTAKVLREHNSKKQVDDIVDLIESIRNIDK